MPSPSWRTVVVKFNLFLAVNKGSYTFTKGMNQKVKIIIRLEFKLNLNNVAVQLISNDVMRTYHSFYVMTS